MSLAVFLTDTTAAHDKIIDPKLANLRAHLAQHVPLFAIRHIFAHVLAVEAPRVVELCADEESVLFSAANLRPDLCQTFKRTLETLLGHVVHPDGAGVGGGDIEVRLVHVQAHGGRHVRVEMLGNVTVRTELGLWSSTRHEGGLRDYARILGS